MLSPSKTWFWGGSVFPAGAGMESISRDATNWLSSRFSLSVETWRGFGWSKMAFIKSPLPSSNLVPFGRWWHATSRGQRQRRGKSGRAQQHTQAYRRTLYRVSKHQIRRGRRTTRLSTSQGSAEPLCARIKGANRKIYVGKADL